MSQSKSPLWHSGNLGNPHSLPDKHDRILAMFNGIAGRYDYLNDILSFGLAGRWRRRAAQLASLCPGDSVLDMCCGTGDLAIAFLREQNKLKEVVGVDFSGAMLANARCKDNRAKWLCADAENLPFEDSQFNCVGCAFGLRNLANPGVGIRQAYRVLCTGGRLVVLEFAMPDNIIFRWGYQCYFRLVLPLIVGMISGDKNNAYRYLPESVRSFDTANRLIELIRESHFLEIKVEKLCCGAVLAIVASK